MYIEPRNLDARFSCEVAGLYPPAVIDEKVYDIANNPEGKISVALSKDVFANKILNDDRFTTGFDFEQFRKIFDIIEKVIMQSISL